MNSKFIEDVINGMDDWVRVLDCNANIIYMNKAMTEGLKSFPTGKKCFNAIGRSEPCEDCISKKAICDGEPHEKEEIIEDRFFSVMSSPIKDGDGKIIAIVEVLRDITQFKKMQKKIMEQNKKLQDELIFARKIQGSLLPKKLLEPRINFTFAYKPSETLGGDFLDIFKIDEDNVGIYIADVSGHGVPASMLTIFLRSSINKKTLSPACALQELYAEFNANNFDHDLYITLFYAIINLKQKTMIYSNAGHNVPPVIFTKDGFEVLNIAGIPISSWVKSPNYSEGVRLLQSGSRIFFSTDGIIELRNENNEFFGEDRIIEFLLNNTANPDQALNSIIEKACSFSGIQNIFEIPDDITMALLEIK